MLEPHESHESRELWIRLGASSADKGDHLIVNSKRCLDVLLTVLVLGFVAQSTVEITRRPEANTRLPVSRHPIVVGDTLLEVTGYFRGGTSSIIRLASDTGTVTILYSFHPECVHSHTVAADWAEHFAAAFNSEVGVRRIAITSDSTDAAYEYAKRFGWSVDVVGFRPLAPAHREYALLSRTPWVFVFDSDGVLRFEGHGNALEQVDQVVAGLSAVAEGREGGAVD